MERHLSVRKAAWEHDWSTWWNDASNEQDWSMIPHVVHGEFAVTMHGGLGFRFTVTCLEELLTQS